MSKFVELDGRKLLDGGCTDSVLVKNIPEKPICNVVVLTRDSGTGKPEIPRMADIVYHNIRSGRGA